MSDWREQAECLDEDPELFFPIGNTGPALLQIEDAKAVCRRCDVRLTCLRWALETGQEAGVWGALSEDERRALKRRNARARGKSHAAPPVVAPVPAPRAEVDWEAMARDLAASGVDRLDIARRLGRSPAWVERATTAQEARAAS